MISGFDVDIKSLLNRVSLLFFDIFKWLLWYNTTVHCTFTVAKTSMLCKQHPYSMPVKHRNIRKMNKKEKQISNHKNR